MSKESEEKIYSEDLFWSTYLKAAEDEDVHVPRSWEANTGSILTFTGLFAATVAAFIIESYKSLSPDPGDQTVALLAQILAATANGSTHTAMHSSSLDSFSVPATAIIVNSLWFASLLISLVCALLATLIQEWSRDYVRGIHRRQTLADESPRNRAFNHIYIRMGVDRYRMESIVYWITGLVHIAVTLFAIGLLVFLFPVDRVVAGIAACILGAVTVTYVTASLLPLLDPSCPYKTPGTYMFSWFGLLYSQLYRSIQWLQNLWNLVPRVASPLKKRTKTQPSDLRQSETQHSSDFLSPSRFAFAWDRTTRYMMDGPFDDILKSVWHVVENNVDANNSRGRQFAKLHTDVGFAQNLERLLTRSYYDSLHIDPEIYNMIVLLFDLMSFYDQAEPADPRRNFQVTARVYLRALGRLAVIARKHEVVEVQLAASLCLAHVRWILIRARGSAPDALAVDDTDVPTENQIENIIPIEGDMVDYGALRLDGNHSKQLSALVEFQSYQALQSSRIEDAQHIQRWVKSTRSGLLPLHDADCCRSWRCYLAPGGWVHEAASNMLTSVTMLLAASDSIMLDILKCTAISGYFSSWPNIFLRIPIERRPPSAMFISALQVAGLHEWLECGSTFWSLPARTPEGRDRHVLTESPGIHVVMALRALAKHAIDWDTYHETQAKQVAAPISTTRNASGLGRPPLTHLRPTFALSETSSSSERGSFVPARTVPSDLRPFSEYTVPPTHGAPPPETQGSYSIFVQSPSSSSAGSDTTSITDSRLSINTNDRTTSHVMTSSRYYRSTIHPISSGDHRPYDLDHPYGPHQPRVRLQVESEEPVIPSPRSMSPTSCAGRDGSDSLDLPELHSVIIN